MTNTTNMQAMGVDWAVTTTNSFSEAPVATAPAIPVPQHIPLMPDGNPSPVFCPHCNSSNTSARQAGSVVCTYSIRLTDSEGEEWDDDESDPEGGYGLMLELDHEDPDMNGEIIRHCNNCMMDSNYPVTLDIDFC